jgi:hypothetical protein
MSTQNDEPLACRLSESQKEARRPDVEALFRDGIDCCPFFQFDVTVHPHDGPVEMRIGGSDRVKSFITDKMIPEVEAARES